MATNNFDPLAYGATPVSDFNPEEYGATLVAPAKKGFLQTVSNAAQARFQNFKSAADNQQGQNTSVLTALHGTGQLAGLGEDIIGAAIPQGVKDVASGLISGLYRNGVPQPVQRFIGNTLSNETAQAGIQGIKDFGAAHPAITQAAGDVGNIAALGADVVGLGQGARAVTQGAKAAFRATPGIVGGPLKEALQSTAEGAVKNSLESAGAAAARAKAVDSLEAKYTELFTGQSPSKQKKFYQANKVSDLKNAAGTEGTPPQRTLAEMGVVPAQKGSRLTTLEQADEVRARAAAFEEANTKALQEADLHVQPTPLPVIEERAVAKVRASNNTSKAKESMIAKIRNEFAAAEAEYGPAAKLETQDTIKSQNWGATKFDTAIPQLERDVHYAIAKAYQENIQNVAQKAGLETVGQLNRHIGDILDGAKFLEGLNGKVLRFGQLGKYAFGIAGTIVGAAASGPLAAIIGGTAGGAIAVALISASVAGPVKRVLLNELKLKNPEAYTKAIQWLESQGKYREGLPRLMAPRPLGSPENPIITPASTTYEPRAQSVNYQNPPQQKLLNSGTPNVYTKPIPLPSNLKEAYLGKQAPKFNAIEKPATKQPIFQGFNDLSTKVLERLKGKSITSKQEILDLTNMSDIKQSEKDIIRKVLAEEGNKVSVKEFADKVKTELLPLKSDKIVGNRYENIALPSDLRGDVANYKERIYESPIKTSAGDVHFDSIGSNNYFAHTRIEEMAPNYMNGKKVERTIELQSDLFQKGRLENEASQFLNATDYLSKADQKEYGQLSRRRAMLEGAENKADYLDEIKANDARIAELNAIANEAKKKDAINRAPEIAKLEPYRNTWQDRIIREDIKSAAQRGVDIKLYPTGETAMKIEGLVNREDKWVTLDNELVTGTNIKAGDLITYQTHEGVPHEDRRFLITKNNGDGTFEAVDSLSAENDSGFYSLIEKKGLLDDGRMPSLEELDGAGALDKETLDYLKGISEQLSAKDTVDTKNPIYKFYEKEIGRYLINNLDAKRIKDVNGVEWYEVPIKKEMAKNPILAVSKPRFRSQMA